MNGIWKIWTNFDAESKFEYKMIENSNISSKKTKPFRKLFKSALNSYIYMYYFNNNSSIKLCIENEYYVVTKFMLLYNL